MTLITNALTEQLLANGGAQRVTMDKGDQALDLGLPVERDLDFVAGEAAAIKSE